MSLTLDEFLKMLYHGLVITFVLLDNVSLVTHRFDLVLDLCLLYQLVDLKVHLLQAPNQIKVGLLEFDKVVVLPLNFEDPLLLPPCEFNLAQMEPRVIYLWNVHF